LKKKPIEVSIDEIHILLVEPLSFKERTWEWDEWSKKIVTEALKRGSYGLLDRIGDNITLEFNRAYITFQPMGKFKTRRIGPWTPPAISIVLNNFKYISVDEYGQEGPSSAIWRHTSRNAKETHGSEPSNHYIDRERLSRHRTLIIFKKVSMDCSISIGYMKEGMTVEETFKNSFELLRNVPVEVHITLHRRLSNAAILAVQIDLSMMTIEVEVDPSFLPTLVHVASGLQYLLAKDRPFIDPLICDEKHDNRLRKKNAPTVQLLEHETELVQTESNVEGIDLQDDDSASDAESEDNGTAPGDCENEDINVSSIEQKPSARAADIVDTDGPAPNSSRLRNRIKSLKFRKTDDSVPKTDDSKEWPAIIMPYGLLIWDKVCLSLSIHSVAVRLRYDPLDAGSDSRLRDSDVKGFVQLSMKGLVSEIIWPQYKDERGGILQLSLAYLCVQECIDKSMRTLLIGGTEHDWFNSPPKNETSFEEFFPLLEPRPVRNDPFDYRSTFPMQTFGFKASICVIEEAQITSSGGRIFVLNEIGINGIEVVFDSDRWGRLISFYSFKGADGNSKFDHRWFSGDWSDHITDDMLISSSTTFDHEEYIQPLQEHEKVEKELSSDLINLTAKLTSVKVRIPAPLHKDADNSDVCISLSECMILISSALPRNFLSENIPGESVGDNEESSAEDTSNLQFPNGLSDLSNDHIHATPGRNIRTQITLTDFSIKAMPPIPFPKSREPLTIISSSKLTFLLSLEKGNRIIRDIDESSTSIFFTALLNDMEINVEFGVLSSITGTILYHIEQLSRTLTPYASVTAIGDEKEGSNLTIFTRLSIPSFDFFLWRHSVSIDSGQATSDLHSQNYIPLLLLLHLCIERIDVGTQSIVHGSTNKLQAKESNLEDRVVVKASVGKMYLSLCDFDSLREQRNMTAGKNLITSAEDSSQGSFKECVNIICFEKGKGTPQLSEAASEKNIVFAMKVESRALLSPCYSAAIEISSGEIMLNMEKIDSFVTLTMEALFEQVSQLNSSKKIETWKDNSIVSQTITSLSSLYSDGTENVVSTTLQEKMDSLFHVSADFIMMRVCINNVMLAVPQSPMGDNYFGLILEATSLCAGSFQQKNISADKKLMLETSSGPDELSWREIFQNESDGLHHTISSRQKCINMDKRQSIKSGTETIIDSFTLESNGQPLKWQGMLSKCTLSIHDLTVLDELCSSLKSCRKYSARIKSEVLGVLSALTLIPYHDCVTRGASKAIARNDVRSPLIAICEASSNSMKSTTLLFAQMKEELAAFENKNRLYLDAKQNEIDYLRSMIFKRERERLSLASLVSNQACGFIRMGGTGLSGQRTVSVTNLWKFWAVLRDSQLIIFKDFSELTPVDYVLLQGAKLRALAGGGRKRDLKQGFVIIDSTGKRRFFLAPSNKDYQMWIHSLSLVINHLRDNSSEKKVNEDANSSSVQSFQQLSCQETADKECAPPTQGTESDNSGSNHGNDLVSAEDDNVSNASSTLDEGAENSPRRRSKLRERMSKLGSAVKNVKITDRNTLFPNAKDVIIPNEDCSSLDALDTQSQNSNPTLKVRSSSNDALSTTSRRNSESKKNSVKVMLGSAVHSVFRPKNSDPLNDEVINPRQGFQGTADTEYVPPAQGVSDDSESNHGNDLVSADDDNASNASSTLDEGAEGNPKHRSKLRERMSKLGSVVKNVKITDRNTLFPKPPSGRKGENENDLYSNRRSNGTIEKPRKMTSLRADVYEPPTKDLLCTKKPEIVKRIVGVWDVKVDYDSKSNLDEAPTSLEILNETCVAIESINKPDAPSSSPKIFRINLTCLQMGESENPPKLTTMRTFSDVINFHSAISETLSSTDRSFVAENMNLAENKAYRDALKDHVIICGNILQSLLEYPDRNKEYLIQCVSDSLAAFIGCLLSNCLPENTYDIVVEFLKLHNTIIDLSLLDDVVHHPFDGVFQSTTEEITSPSGYAHLIQKCESELIKSNYQILKAKAIASTPDQSHSTKQVDTHTSPALSSSVYNEEMQEALAAVMAERDEAHVQLIASRVIHSHEMEQERRRVFVLKNKLEYTERFCNDDSGAVANFFLGQEITEKNSINKIEMQMIQNTDEELLALCRQLSSEISLRVSGELEILRLKERRKIDHDVNIAEQAILREEVQRCKKQLKEEAQRRQLAEDEKRRWEQSFQQLINNPDVSI